MGSEAFAEKKMDANIHVVASVGDKQVVHSAKKGQQPQSCGAVQLLQQFVSSVGRRSGRTAARVTGLSLPTAPVLTNLAIPSFPPLQFSSFTSH